jgi:redox-sensitive bicupin YhaK (pirin superfamily)
MTANETLRIPTAPFVHVYVAKGEAALEGAGLLTAGDAVRVSAAEGQRLTAGDGGAEVLLWEMDASVSFG